MIDHKDNKFNRWELAFRRRGEEAYTVIPSPEYGWVADPFLVDFHKEIYLFAEIFLWGSERKGVIGYSKYMGNSFGQWNIAMDRPWHLSYPFVFVQDDQLYMVPESYQLNEVVLYELKEFPDKWRKVRSFAVDVEYCDSTFFKYLDGNVYMFTFERGKISPYGKGLLFRVTENGLTDCQIFSENIAGARCGGKIQQKGDKYIRVALIIRNRIYNRLKDKMKSMAKRPNYMTVPAAIRELEKIEMVRLTDAKYHLDHAVTATQKEILDAFNLNDQNVKYRASEISKQL